MLPSCAIETRVQHKHLRGFVARFLLQRNCIDIGSIDRSIDYLNEAKNHIDTCPICIDYQITKDQPGGDNPTIEMIELNIILNHEKDEEEFALELEYKVIIETIYQQAIWKSGFSKLSVFLHDMHKFVNQIISNPFHGIEGEFGGLPFGDKVEIIDTAIYWIGLIINKIEKEYDSTEEINLQISNIRELFSNSM